MNTNVDLFHDSTNNSNGILTSESNEMGSLKIIIPDKLTQLSIKSSYICHVDDPMIDRGNYYYPDISSDLKEGYDYSLTRMLMSSYNDGIHEPDPKGLFDSFPLLGLMFFSFGNFPCHFPGTTTSRPSGLVASLPHSLHSPMPLYGCSSLA